MPWANMFARQSQLRQSRMARLAGGHGDRLPRGVEDLHGPARGVILLPRHLAWPGMRECDVSDEASRRALYAMLLARGTREEIIRLVSRELLAQDWPLLADAIEPGVRLVAERVFEPAEGTVGGRASAPAGDLAPDANPVALA